jgi:MFS family permease
MSVRFPERLQVLQNRNFRLYFVGQFISLTGTWMQGFAGSWVVLRLTDSTFALAIVNFAVALPSLIFMLYGGMTADRYDRRRILITTQAAQMLLALLAGVLVATGAIEFWQIVLLSFALGVAQAFNMPAEQALVPSLVEPRQIPQAIALNQVIFNGSRLVGPAVAGLAVAALGLASAYFANVVSYVAVIASLLLIRVAVRPRAAVPASAMAAIREGLSHVWRERLLRTLMGVNGATSLFVFPCLAVLSPAYVRQALGAGPGWSAVLMAASGAASLFGAFALLWVPSHRRGVTMLGCIALQALALVAMAATSNPLLATVFFGSLSLGMGLVFGLNATTVQEVTPDAIRGRVMSVSGMMFGGVVPFSTILVGAAVELLTIRVAFGLCGVLYLATAGVLLLRSGMVGHAPEELIAASPAPVPAEPVAAGD